MFWKVRAGIADFDELVAESFQRGDPVERKTGRTPVPLSTTRGASAIECKKLD